MNAIRTSCAARLNAIMESAMTAAAATIVDIKPIRCATHPAMTELTIMVRMPVEITAPAIDESRPL